MISIFYDLETSDLEKVGQILNFAFVAVDSKFKVISSLAKKVKISRLQLPQVGAILANKTNVLKHQKEANLTEAQAVNEIQNYINQTLQLTSGEPIALIGFNSSNFDLGFLRTVFIRNAKNPYFTNVVHKDLLVVAKYLMVNNQNFRSKIFEFCKDKKPNLKLETLCRAFSLLDKEQEHESLADVLLTISLAKEFIKHYKVDVREFEPYAVKKLHQAEKGSVFFLAEPLISNYTEDKFSTIYPATLLDYNDKYALWINLETYQKLSSKEKDASSAVKWKKQAEDLLLSLDKEVNDELYKLATKALKDLSKIKLANFFEEATCDIEQHIYRIPPNCIKVIERTINEGFSLPNLSKDIKYIAKRYWLENFKQEPNEEFTKAMKNYALYRYGGKLLLRNIEKDKSTEENLKKCSHPTFKTMYKQIEEKIEDASAEQKELLLSLKEFYLKSEIYQYAKEELS